MSLYNPDSYVGDFILRAYENIQFGTAWRSPRTTTFPRVNWYPGPYGNPGINEWGHRTYPSLSRPGIGYVAYQIGHSMPLLVPVAAMVAATDVFPTVAGPQYQSAMSGQPSGSDPNLLFGKPQGWNYFLQNFR